MSDEAELRARHVENGETRSFEPQRCVIDSQVWPCDTVRALALLDAERALADRLADELREHERELELWVGRWMEANPVQVANGYLPYQHKPSLALRAADATAALAALADAREARDR